MRIYLDGQQLPLELKVNKELLLTLKSIAQVQNWRIHYDAPKGIVYLNTDPRSHAGSDRHPFINVEMDSTRLLGKTICIDPGHGGNDAGTIGSAGTCEKEHALAIALLLRDKLERNGAKVVMTRETDQSVAHDNASAEEELDARIALVKHAKADLFISLHSDGFFSASTNGVTTYHHGDPESSRLAFLVLQRLAESLGIRNRGSHYASLYLIRHITIPSVVAEIAFLSNPDEEMMLVSDEGRQKAAAGLFDGIVSYFRV